VPAGRESLAGMELAADCSRCVGLCCVVLPFARSADFAFDKPAGTPCRHLTGDHRCGIHDGLLGAGMRGCVAYDCFGAGQAVTATGRLEAFAVVEQVHEIAWYLTDAQDRGAPVDELLDDARRLAGSGRPSQLGVDGLRSRVAPALRAVAEDARSSYDDPLRAAGTDLAGADLCGHDLRGADLRGALLIGADLRGADLADADLLGADLRGADASGADLSGALFVTRRQLGALRAAPDPSGTPAKLRT
jgi:Pentapeptide repeats (8 copies)